MKRIKFIIITLLLVVLLAACRAPVIDDPVIDDPVIVGSTLTPGLTPLVATPTLATGATQAAATATSGSAATATTAAATATGVPATATSVPPTATTAASRPESIVTRITFPAGSTSDVVEGRVGAGQRDIYLFRAQAGQEATVTLSSPGNTANFALSGQESGLTYKGANDPARQWSGTLPGTQDYAITVTAPSTTGYSLTLTIAPLELGSIRGLVWRDANRDNSPNDDEPVVGAPVRLRGGVECNTPVAQTTTVTGGAYAFFDLPAGTYCVEVVTAEVELRSVVELAAGEDAVDVNLVWPGPEEEPVGSIRGLVWRDTNRSDSMDDDEPVVGALVRLLGGANCGSLLGQTTTVTGGAYAFTEVPAGTYCVEAASGEVTVSTVVQLGAGQDAVDVNLMWPGE